LTGHYYRHYGLTLCVNQELPHITPDEGQTADIKVEVLDPGERVGSDLPWVMPDPLVSLWRAQTDRGSWLRIRYSLADEWLEFVVDERGDTVWVTRSPTVGLDEAAGLLLGPVLSSVLGRRGLTCVHAAVIALDGKTIALVGHSGAGKSTTALALVQHGGALIADDVAVLTESSGRVTVAAAARTPRLRMQPDSARWLLGSYESLNPTWSEERPMPPKRYFDVPPAEGITDEGGHTLDVLYILGWTDPSAEPSIARLSPARALAKLMAHRHMTTSSEPTSHPRDFELLARLAESAPVNELVRPTGLQSTEQTVAAIISDVRDLT
jgi:hypothetical protein